MSERKDPIIVGWNDRATNVFDLVISLSTHKSVLIIDATSDGSQFWKNHTVNSLKDCLNIDAFVGGALHRMPVEEMQDKLFRFSPKGKDIGIVPGAYDTVLDYTASAIEALNDFQKLDTVTEINHGKITMTRSIIHSFAVFGKFDIVLIALPLVMCPFAQMMIAVCDAFIITPNLRQDYQFHLNAVFDQTMNRTAHLRVKHPGTANMPLPASVQKIVRPDHCKQPTDIRYFRSAICNLLQNRRNLDATEYDN